MFLINSTDCTQLYISMAMVIGPTPIMDDGWNQNKEPTSISVPREAEEEEIGKGGE